MRAPSSHSTDARRPLLTPLRILVVSSRSMVRAKLRLLVEGRPGLTIIGETSSLTGAISAAGREKPDLIFLDVHSHTRKRTVLIRELSAAVGARLLVLADEYDNEARRQAVRNGAEDLFVMGRMPQALTAVLYPEAEKLAELTEREMAITTLVAVGLDDKKIAIRLALPDAIVRAHLQSIFTKLGVTDRLELVVYSFLHGIVGDKHRGQKVLPRRPMSLSKGPKMKSGRRSVA